MKVSRTQAEENRSRVIEVAGKLLRERGFEGIGISDVMKVAGLTHGGYYVTFASKKDLAVQACERAFSIAMLRWRAVGISGLVTASPCGYCSALCLKTAS